MWRAVRGMEQQTTFLGCVALQVVLRQNSNPHRKSGDSLARQLEEKTGMGPTGREILSCGERPHELRIYMRIYKGWRNLALWTTLHWCGCGLSSSIVTMMQPPKSL